MQISTVGSLNKGDSISGFSFMELIVVMFILSILAFFTIPVFKAQGIGQQENSGDRQMLVGFIEALRQKSVRENQDYLLHLDLLNGRVWATGPVSKASELTSPETEKQEAEFQLSGSSLSGVELVNQADPPMDDTVVRIFSNGTVDMALIHLATEDGDITLKLHPFISDVEIIQGVQSFNDCF